MSETEVLEIATPIMDNLMQASTDIDHAKHVKDFTDRAKAIVTKEHLEWVCKKYQSEKGIFGKREPIAVLRRPGSAAIIWKQYFSEVEGEYVAEIVLTYVDGKFLVDHAMVF
ncbi:hypothetical protein KO495_10350 [Colwellia sp. D2M02]|uniref:hypothetical protein n=1 Tax=Colwellia sp. D2M02 TaxID=2841562 RepID=UPI001C0976FB|nr:hypothetical protein [Colwellia sp. D2M02]MBU2893721.1 hypothetical protein [Colwellia sp. D2M02]